MWGAKDRPASAFNRYCVSVFLRDFSALGKLAP